LWRVKRKILYGVLYRDASQTAALNEDRPFNQIYNCVVILFLVTNGGIRSDIDNKFA